MKRFFAFILFLVFMTFKCLTWVPSAAATGIPAFDAFYYAILQTLGMAYTNGVEMDLAPAIADVRENIPDYLQQPDNALKYLLRDYAAKIWDNSIMQWSDSANEPAVTAELAAIRIASNEVSTPTLNDIVAQYQKKALDTDYQVTTPINTKAIAFWNKYNSLYINDYLDKINSIDSDIVIPTPDPQFEVFLDRINGSGFWWKNYANIRYTNTSQAGLFYYPPSSVTWASYTANQFSNQNTWVYPYCLPIQTINITSSNGTYSFNHSISNNDVLNQFFGNNGIVGRGGVIYSNGFDFNGYNPNIRTNVSYSGSLGECLNQIYYYFRNVNIYVDGVLWSNVGGPVVSNFSSSVPNSVIDNSTDDGKIVSNPIYWTVDENTGTPIDAQINLDKLIDYLKGVIDGSNTDTSVDYGDLVDAGVIEKGDGTAITDSNVIAVPVADAIDDALADSDVIDTPITAIDDLPPLPPLPPFFPTPDFPEGDPTSGFHGMSVLARIINITNQSLPDDLVITFYGVMFGAIVLGLIKILHK